MSNSTSHRLSEGEFRLLARAEPGHVFRASDAESEEFGDLVERLLKLRARGLLRLEDGPCDLTEAGRAALARDRRLGPSP